jgi:hypothetical protein
MYNFTSTTAEEPSYINWDIQQEFNSRGLKSLATSNFQDIYNLTKRTNEVQVKMNKLKFRAQGIGGMIGIGAGALGGPLGSIVGFGVGRMVGGFIGNGLAQKYYGEEQGTVNEHLFTAKQRDTQLKYQIGEYGSLGDLIATMRQNKVNDDKKIIQDMMVL